MNEEEIIQDIERVTDFDETMTSSGRKIWKANVSHIIHIALLSKDLEHRKVLEILESRLLSILGDMEHSDTCVISRLDEQGNAVCICQIKKLYPLLTLIQDKL